MGNLNFIIKGMEVERIPEDKRDVSVRELANLILYAKKNDNCYIEKGMKLHQFKYGNLFNDFIYADWGTFCKKEEFKGIKQATLQLLYNICSEKPSLGKEIDNNVFKALKMPSGKAGMNIPDIGVKDYIYDYSSWKKMKIDYFSLHQDEIDWDTAENDFLPFRSFSNGILLDEIKSHKKEKEFNDEYIKLENVHKKKDNEIIRSKAIANVFHNHVMKNKGAELFTYAKEIGTKVCLGNGYVFDHELSKKESKKTGKNRYIYRILNRNKEIQYISIDTKHGMFEFHNKNGDHLGEYRFNGELNSEAVHDHSLKSI